MFNQWIWTHSIQFISDKLISKPYIYIHFNQKQYKEQLPSVDMLHYVTQQWWQFIVDSISWKPDFFVAADPTNIFSVAGGNHESPWHQDP
jgi:hypothetical protein